MFARKLLVNRTIMAALPLKRSPCLVGSMVCSCLCIFRHRIGWPDWVLLGAESFDRRGSCASTEEAKLARRAIRYSPCLATWMP